MSSADRTFEGVTEAQKSLIAHWKCNLDTDGNVPRHKIDPGMFCKDLANISMVDVGPDHGAVFRLAGSGLRDLFGCELRGKTVEAVLGEAGETFQLTVAAAIEKQRPVGGLIETDGTYHAWLRLPLVGANGSLALVLCLDERFESEQELKRKIETPQKKAFAA